MANEHGGEREREPRSLRAPGQETEYVTPPVDIYETDKAHVVLMDVPGVSRDDLDIHVEQNQLTVRARVSREDRPKLAHREFRLRDYYRAFTLVDEIDTERISASLNDGVLRVELPKSPRAQARRVTVA
jgi:HSP20 family molecular chaperone IbpA